MSLIGVVPRFSTGTYTFTRRAAETYTDGIVVAGATSTFTAQASIQPVSGRELQALAEAQHGQEVKVIYCNTELLTRTPTQAPDTVSLDSETWEVFRVERWQAFGQTHWRAYAQRRVLP